MYKKPMLVSLTWLLCAGIVSILPSEVYGGSSIINPSIDPIIGADPNGEAVVARILARFFAAALAVAAITFLLYLVFGAYKWLTSGGDKGGLTSAQQTMTQALVGLIILASIFAIARIVGTLLGLSCPAGNFPDVICWPEITAPAGSPTT